MSKTNKFFTLFSFCVLSLLFGYYTNAQSTGIRISPTRIEDIVEPGQILQAKIKVTNQGSETRELFMYVRDFKAEGESGQAKLIQPGSEEGYFLASWIKTDDQGVPFEPNEEKEVSFIVEVPDEVGPGGYYGAIVIGAKPPKVEVDSPDKGAGMSISQQAASLILLQVKGDVKEEATIRDFVTDSDAYNTPFHINFEARIENLGNVHVKPVGNIKITNMFGKNVDNLFFNENGANVLPNTTRKFPMEWFGETGFGKYTAELGLSYGTEASQGGEGKKTMIAYANFWIIPWKIITIIGLSILFLITLAWLLLRLYKNKAIKRAMEQAGIAQVKYVKQYQGPSPALHITIILIAIFILLFLLISISYFIFFA